MAHLRPRPIHFLALLLALQALFLAFFVTPLGDIPDESGHYAYVIDMTKGRPLPVLGKPEHGKGEIPADLWKDYEGLVERHRVNYIVQHPPLYYAVAAIPYALTKSVTQDKATLARSARVVSALSLGLLILVIVGTLNLMRSSTGRAFVAIRDSETAAKSMGIKGPHAVLSSGRRNWRLCWR